MERENQHNFEQPFAQAYGAVNASGIMRDCVDDFIVEEKLSFQPTAEGQHAYLNIRKRDLNTVDVVNRLAKFLQCKPSSIGYAGLKDKRAVTSQWFSADLRGSPDPDWSGLNAKDLEILEVTRHSRKLKIGAIAENGFDIVIRHLQGDAGELEQKLLAVKQQGVPNYFGEQRFGKDYANARKALRWFAGEAKAPKKHQRSMVISAARSYLFNAVLSKRVEQGSWNTPLMGDVMGLRGSRSYFVPDLIDGSVLQRCSSGDISPTGPLWGDGDLPVTGGVQDLELDIASQHQVLIKGLVAQGLQQQRRALRVMLDDLQWVIDNDSLKLSFRLPSGSYATSVLREMINPPHSPFFKGGS